MVGERNVPTLPLPITLWYNMGEQTITSLPEGVDAWQVVQEVVKRWRPIETSMKRQTRSVPLAPVHVFAGAAMVGANRRFLWQQAIASGLLPILRDKSVDKRVRARAARLLQRIGCAPHH